MNKISTIIVEDEKSSLTTLLGKLKKNCPNIQVVSTCQTGEEAIESIHKLQPRLVFLDVRLGTMTGFDVLDRLQHIQFDIIFTTAFDQYALKAIKANAMDYLMKPISEKELIAAVNKVWWKTQQLESGLQRIAVRESNGMRFIDTIDILYCEANDNYSNIYLVNENKPILVTRPLSDIDRKLPSSRFFRIHRSYTVNLGHVKSFSREDGGYVMMMNRKKLPFPRSNRDGFLERFNKR